MASTKLVRQCGACRGTGQIVVSGEYLATWNLLAKLGEMHAAALAVYAGCKATAMNNRLLALHEHGFVTYRYERGNRREKLFRVVLPKHDG